MTVLADVSVASERGVVTLNGKVDGEAVRQAAEEVAEAQEGVVEVIDDLAVEEDQFTDQLTAGEAHSVAKRARL